MSVINQMLKDLDQRSPESNGPNVQLSNIKLAASPMKIALISGICVFAVCIISFYVWQLISENNALKAEQINNRQVTKQVTNQISNQVSGQLSNQTTNSADMTESRTVNPAKTLAANENKTYQAAITPSEPQQSKIQSDKAGNQQVIIPKSVVKNHSQEVTAKPIVSNGSTRITPAKKMAEVTDDHSHSGSVSSHSHDATETVKIESKTNANKMSVSRRQLSADELAEQKLTLAEKALSAKQIGKAEKLLEEVVIIKPNDSQTRKKLAALWFGRQAYQDAVNLLSQGIALNNKDSSLRQMKARIHLKQGQVTAALNTLKPLAQLKDEQYQIMLANTAQQAQKNEVAVEAYKVLIAMQPDLGRWYLGLAVLHDKSSQFNLAKVAYNQALKKNDLSVSSVNFVEQRIHAIGQ